MSVVKINAITVPSERGDELAARFAARLGAVENAEGFEEFQLLRPSDDRNIWLVYTRWRDEESFQAWVRSPAFAHGHSADAAPGQAPHGGGHPHAGGSGEAGGHPHGGGAGGRPGLVGTSAELWSFFVEQRAGQA